MGILGFSWMALKKKLRLQPVPMISGRWWTHRPRLSCHPMNRKLKKTHSAHSKKMLGLHVHRGWRAWKPPDGPGRESIRLGMHTKYRANNTKLYKTRYDSLNPLCALCQSIAPPSTDRSLHLQGIGDLEWGLLSRLCQVLQAFPQVAKEHEILDRSHRSHAPRGHTMRLTTFILFSRSRQRFQQTTIKECELVEASILLWRCHICHLFDFKSDLIHSFSTVQSLKSNHSTLQRSLDISKNKKKKTNAWLRSHFSTKSL